MKIAIASLLLVLTASDSLAAGAVLRRPTAGPVPDHGEIGRLVRGRGQALYCGGIGMVDLGSAIDRPAFFFLRSDGRVIGRCGGFCRTPEGRQRCRRECPPPGWSC